MTPNVVGENTVVYFTVLDVGGDPVSGVTWEQVSSSGPETTYVIQENGPGVYSFTFTPAAEGTYFALFRTDTTPVQWFELQEDVTVGGTGAASVLPTNERGSTLIDLMVACAYQLGDFIEITATEAGSDTKIKDQFELLENPNSMIGAELLFWQTANPANYLQRRRVTQNDPHDYSATFLPPLPAATSEGDVVYVFNRMTRGFRTQQIKRAINNAIRLAGQAGNKVKMQYTFSGEDRFNANFPSFVVPEPFTHVYRIEYSPNNGASWDTIPMAYAADGSYPGWGVDVQDGTIHVTGGSAWRANNQYLRISGYAEPGPLDDYLDETSVPREWLIATVCHYLALGKGDLREMQITFNRKNEADAIRAAMITLGEANTVRIR